MTGLQNFLTFLDSILPPITANDVFRIKWINLMVAVQDGRNDNDEPGVCVDNTRISASCYRLRWNETIIMYYQGVMLLRRQSKLSIPLIRYLLPAHGPHCTAPVAEDCVARKCDRFKRIEYCDALSCILRHASLTTGNKIFCIIFCVCAIWYVNHR